MGAGGLLKLSARNVMQTEEQEHCGFKSRPGAYVVLEVSDTGEGIPPEMLHKIFDAFFTTKDPDKGTGLGLSTVQTVVRNHGGFVNVESTLGGGTTFKVHLPALRSSIETRGKRVAPLPPGNGELLLIVDDEAAIRDVARATLETYGYRVLLAADGEEALKTFLQCRNDIKVVLSDVNMPGMGGEQLGRTIELLHPGMAVIFMSGVAPGPGLSARPFIQKPFTAQRLLTVLRDALHGQNALS
jgi:CheY-like chemotaxis protein